MFLLHNVFEKYSIIKKILEEGFLKSSIKTKKTGMLKNNKVSQFIYLRISQKGDNSADLFLDPKILLSCIFYLNIGWHGEIYEKTTKIDGRKLTEIQLNEVLNKFKLDIKKSIINNKKNNILSPLLTSNEILVRKNISLHKYLKKISINNKYTKYINNNYPNIIIL
jgi:hypothetical protein